MVITKTKMDKELRIKEIIELISPYISLSQIAKQYFKKSRQWLYQKINGNTVNGIKYNLTGEELDKLISSLEDIKNNLHSTIGDLKKYKEEREKRIPETDRLLVERLEEELFNLIDKGKGGELEKRVKELYKSKPSKEVKTVLGQIITLYGWELKNFTDEKVKYNGEEIESITRKLIYKYRDRYEKELSKNIKKKEEKEVNWDSFSLSSSTLNSDIENIVYKIYYTVNNNIKMPQHIGKRIENINPIIKEANVSVADIEKEVYKIISYK